MSHSVQEGGGGVCTKFGSLEGLSDGGRNHRGGRRRRLPLPAWPRPWSRPKVDEEQKQGGTLHMLSLSLSPPPSLVYEITLYRSSLMTSVTSPVVPESPCTWQVLSAHPVLRRRGLGTHVGILPESNVCACARASHPADFRHTILGNAINRISRLLRHKSRPCAEKDLCKYTRALALALALALPSKFVGI